MSHHSRKLFSFPGIENISAPGEDRTHDLQMARVICDYETDALPTALPRQVDLCRSMDLSSEAPYETNTGAREEKVPASQA